METVDILILIASLVSIMVLILKKSNMESTISNQNIQSPQKRVNITIDTDGENTYIKAASIFGPVDNEEDMIKEIGMEASSDILNYRSTVQSLKYNLEKIAQKYNYTAHIIINSQFGRDKLPFPATVSGNSMYPTLKDGQYVMALKTMSFEVGDIVIARHSNYGLIIKRVVAMENGRAYLKSDNRDVEVINKERVLSNGIIEIQTQKKIPLDTWQPERNIIAVVKDYQSFD